MKIPDGYQMVKAMRSSQRTSRTTEEGVPPVGVPVERGVFGFYYVSAVIMPLAMMCKTCS
jgi:hypothetical protein